MNATTRKLQHTQACKHFTPHAHTCPGTQIGTLMALKLNAPQAQRAEWEFAQGKLGEECTHGSACHQSRPGQVTKLKGRMEQGWQEPNINRAGHNCTIHCILRYGVCLPPKQAWAGHRAERWDGAGLARTQHK